MRASFKKAIGAAAAAGAISVACPAIASAAELEVPDVSGMTVFEASETLYDAGFDNVRSSSPRSEDLVVRTNYPPGSTVDEETTILLIVAN